MYWEHKHAKKNRGWNLLETCHSCDHGPCQCWQMALQDHQHGHQNSQKNNSSLSCYPQSVILGVSLNHFRCIDDWQEIMALNEWCSFQHERVPPAACVAEWAFIDFNMQIWKDFFLKAYISGTGQGIYKLYTCIWYDHTSRAARGGGGSFKNRKLIGEIGCCESRMTKRKHWWIWLTAELSNWLTG